MGFLEFLTNDLSFASTETKFKNPITKTQNDFFGKHWLFSQIISKQDLNVSQVLA